MTTTIPFNEYSTPFRDKQAQGDLEAAHLMLGQIPILINAKGGNTKAVQ